MTQIAKKNWSPDLFDLAASSGLEFVTMSSGTLRSMQWCDSLPRLAGWTERLYGDLQ